MSEEEQEEEQRRRDQESINSAVRRIDHDGLSEVMRRRDQTIRLLSLIWLLIVGGLIGYAMASCLADLVERA